MLARFRECLAEALARRRVPLGFIVGALVLWLAEPTGRTLVVGLAIACVGEALRVWAAGHLNKSREVTSSGPYRWFAHPLYIGSSLMGAGLAAASGRIAPALLIAAYLGATLNAAMKNEEASLRRKFGDRYDRYRRGHTASAEEARRRFSVARAIANREHRAIAGMGIALLLLLLKATYNNGLLWRAAAGQ